MGASLKLVPEGHPVNEVVIALVGGREGAEPHPAGSAVLIAPGLALTARHVIDDFWDRFGGDREQLATFSLQAIHYIPGVSRPAVWHVVNAFHADAIDIAVLALEPAANVPAAYQPPRLRLDVLSPNAGTPVQAFGYPLSVVLKEPGGWVLHHDAVGAVGSVTQEFPDYRDRGMLSFPCFEMSLAIEAGMSGGPVFDSAGHLRGIVCSSVDPDKVPSYASALWPAMGLPALSAKGDRGRPALLQLARNGSLDVLNHADLVLEDDSIASKSDPESERS